eukprot:1583900-Prymnesium_polylepis.1
MGGLEKGGGSSWVGVPRGAPWEGGFPRGLGRACVACACIRLQSSRASDWDRESTKEGGLKNEDAGG